MMSSPARRACIFSSFTIEKTYGGNRSIRLNSMPAKLAGARTGITPPLTVAVLSIVVLLLPGTREWIRRT
jgi:hypothetical protein